MKNINLDCCGSKWMGSYVFGCPWAGLAFAREGMGGLPFWCPKTSISTSEIWATSSSLFNRESCLASTQDHMSRRSFRVPRLTSISFCWAFESNLFQKVVVVAKGFFFQNYCLSLFTLGLFIVAQGLGEREAHTLPFRLESDLTLMADTDKKPVMLCQFACKLARDRGFGEVDLEDHSFKQKTRAVVVFRLHSVLGNFWSCDKRRLLNPSSYMTHKNMCMKRWRVNNVHVFLLLTDVNHNIRG